MNVTVEQLENMMHALGVNPSIKKLKMYRNRYIIDNDDSWNDLVNKGLAIQCNSLNMNYYCVSETGKQLINRLTGALDEEDYEKANKGVKPIDIGNIDNFECGECGNGTIWKEETNYCPVCGTKVDRSDEE